ncbi:hypothetical protein DY052_07645 [Apilactobacillus timberlakei]|uniref:hypothetical protein n=1 Tax=Apilactobacillus timberlakei TaxID=2008380 RepID=UPI0011260C00|nr:hypothetical protein [Apilactobacillus timberlakei]TPR13727.1 hypothetical protein DY052_07645 [Apilactobacillus timberlakei]
MSFIRKKPLIICNTIIQISSKDINTNIELNDLVQEYDEKYKQNNLTNYNLVSNKDNNFKMAFSPLALDRFLSLLKANITTGKEYSEHDTYHNIEVNMNIIYDEIDNEFMVTDEFELCNFGEVSLTSNFNNVTELFNQFLFFKLNDEISNLDIDQEYKQRTKIADVLLKIFLTENKNIFDQKFIATKPNKEQFANQDTKSVHLPIFETSSNDSHKEKDYEVEDKNDNELKNTSKDGKPNNKIVKYHLKKPEHTPNNNHQVDIFDKNIPFVPNEIIKRIKFNKPKYLFDIPKDSQIKYRDVKDAINNGNFDFQAYLIEYNNNYKKSANKVIQNRVDQLRADFKAEMVSLISNHHDEMDKVDKENEKYLSDNSSIKDAANNYLKQEFFNKREPELLKERDAKKKRKEQEIMNRAEMEIKQMRQDVDNEYQNKLKNSNDMIYANAQNMANDKITQKNNLVEQRSKDTKIKLKNRLLNNIQSAYNKCEDLVQQTSYTLYTSFNNELEARQSPLIDKIVTIIQQQVSINKSKIKMKMLRKDNKEEFERRAKQSGFEISKTDNHGHPSDNDNNYNQNNENDVASENNNEQLNNNNNDNDNEKDKGDDNDHISDNSRKTLEQLKKDTKII